MSYSGMHYLPPAWESAGPGGRIDLRVAAESDPAAVTLSIRRSDGREVDISIDLDGAIVHDEWEFPGEGTPSPAWCSKL